MRASLPATPEIVSIELTDRCAKACWFCYNHSSPAGAHAWPVDQLADFVLQCAAHGTRAVSFGGGEPLEYPPLFDLLARLRGRLFRSITTNGLPLDAATIVRLVDVGLDKLHVSLHFPDRADEVDRVIAQVQAVAAAGIASGVNLLVDSSRLDAAAHAAHRLRESGIGNDRIVYLPMRVRNTPTPLQLARVAGDQPFQSMSCLASCGRSPRFLSIDSQRRIGWCSYTAARYTLELPDLFASLLHHLRDLGLTYCGNPADNRSFHPPRKVNDNPAPPPSAIPAPAPLSQPTTYPAAHSMDISWFAVDANGLMAIVDADSEGWVPVTDPKEKKEIPNRYSVPISRTRWTMYSDGLNSDSWRYLEDHLFYYKLNYRGNVYHLGRKATNPASYDCIKSLMGDRLSNAFVLQTPDLSFVDGDPIAIMDYSDYCYSWAGEKYDPENPDNPLPPLWELRNLSDYVTLAPFRTMLGNWTEGMFWQACEEHESSWLNLPPPQKNYDRCFNRACAYFVDVHGRIALFYQTGAGTLASGARAFPNCRFNPQGWQNQLRLFGSQGHIHRLLNSPPYPDRKPFNEDEAANHFLEYPFEYFTPARYGFYHYVMCWHRSGPYVRIATPRYDIRIADMPEVWRDTYRPVELPNVDFANMELVQPAQHVPCDMDSPVWLAEDLQTVRFTADPATPVDEPRHQRAISQYTRFLNLTRRLGVE